MGLLGRCAGRDTRGALSRCVPGPPEPACLGLGGSYPGTCGRGQPRSLRRGRLRMEQHGTCSHECAARVPTPETKSRAQTPG